MWSVGQRQGFPSPFFIVVLLILGVARRWNLNQCKADTVLDSHFSISPHWYRGHKSGVRVCAISLTYPIMATAGFSTWLVFCTPSGYPAKTCSAPDHIYSCLTGSPCVSSQALPHQHSRGCRTPNNYSQPNNNSTLLGIIIGVCGAL